jgi:hypothetical protein
LNNASLLDDGIFSFMFRFDLNNSPSGYKDTEKKVLTK